MLGLSVLSLMSLLSLAGYIVFCFGIACLSMVIAMRLHYGYEVVVVAVAMADFGKRDENAKIYFASRFPPRLRCISLRDSRRGT